ncbi:Bye1p NDAI_0K02450 [Naumovozyma dairenensis CBS 421]|uniref:Transcription factor BYE1 n=1 Tax=Naumovozyma dairenensis (strain ATCC 10597 / BCRC 20456 / CBS 421 / NBRC 0211 / NRRL Y-12639) TaxID=1071378 RepID=G0WI25_NAUDC|nr:hypothetical protein NDAI_0K02450 [Naumovozyma dairenensis CBS 421]CCD27436.1 hypothetical protein NDAI_0K02450 [Naumovozyma dairenensis CBS 421]
MSVRTSARSNKGQNKYMEAMAKEEQEQEQEQENPTIISTDDKEEYGEGNVRCPVCGTTDENYDPNTDTNGDMVQCDGCDMWQHIKCMTGGLEDIESLLTPDRKYFCEKCDPTKYPHLNLNHQNDDDQHPEYVNKNVGVQPHTKDEDGDYMPNINDNIHDLTDDKDQNLDDENVNNNNNSSSNPTNNNNNNNATITKRRKSAQSNSSNAKKRKSTSAEVPTSSSSSSIPAAERDSKMRVNALKMFNDLFMKFIIPETINAKLYELPQGKTIQLISNEFSKNLESELYKAWFDMEHDKLSKYYPEKVRNLFSNLKDPKNLNLKSHVINQSIPMSKLVRMSVSELANPDLQQFKEKVNTDSLNQLVIEAPTKPKYIKTHKGDELIENYDEGNDLDDSMDRINEDIIYEKNSIQTRKMNDLELHDTTNKAPSSSALPSSLSSSTSLNQQKINDNDNTIHSNDNGQDMDIDSNTDPETEQGQEEEQQQEQQQQENEKGVTINYPELGYIFSGNIKYHGISHSIKSQNVKQLNIFGNEYDPKGNYKLFAEGRLSSSKAFDYLDQIKSSSSRVILIYQLFQTNDHANGDDNGACSRLFDHLIEEKRVVGIRNKQKYEKIIYLIPHDRRNDQELLQIQNLIDENLTEIPISNDTILNDRTFFLVVVVKPEFIGKE